MCVEGGGGAGDVTGRWQGVRIGASSGFCNLHDNMQSPDTQLSATSECVCASVCSICMNLNTLYRVMPVCQQSYNGVIKVPHMRGTLR